MSRSSVSIFKVLEDEVETRAAFKTFALHSSDSSADLAYNVKVILIKYYMSFRVTAQNVHTSYVIVSGLTQMQTSSSSIAVFQFEFVVFYSYFAYCI